MLKRSSLSDKDSTLFFLLLSLFVAVCFFGAVLKRSSTLLEVFVGISNKSSLSSNT